MLLLFHITFPHQHTNPYQWNASIIILVSRVCFLLSTKWRKPISKFWCIDFAKTVGDIKYYSSQPCGHYKISINFLFFFLHFSIYRGNCGKVEFTFYEHWFVCSNIIIKVKRGVFISKTASLSWSNFFHSAPNLFSFVSNLCIYTFANGIFKMKATSILSFIS